MLTPDTPFQVVASQQREVERLIADGLLEPLLPGVVGPIGCSERLDARLASVVLALPERVLGRAALAQAAAVWVWCGGAPPSVVDVAVPPGRSVPRLPFLAAHQRRMPPQDVALLPSDGASVQVTTPTRTLVDLLRLLPEAPGTAAAGRLATVGGVTPDGVAACLDRMPRARGVPRARVLAAALVFAPTGKRSSAGG